MDTEKDSIKIADETANPTPKNVSQERNHGNLMPNY